jgi:hypothetical protein
MKKTMRLSPWLLALNLSLGAMSMLVGTAHAQALPGSEAGQESVELGNTAGSADAAPAATDVLAAEATPTPTPVLESAETEPAKDPRELHRDLVMQMPEVVPAGTSAASRRYRKVDLSAYRTMMQGNAAPAAQ